jgi:hypothetical protein
MTILSIKTIQGMVSCGKFLTKFLENIIYRQPASVGYKIRYETEPELVRSSLPMMDIQEWKFSIQS